MIVDKHTLALVSIIGSSLDVLGALYLAYDLLGGEHGPLRILTRGVTYGALFGAGYSIGLGPGIWARGRHSARHHTGVGVVARVARPPKVGILV